MILLINICKEKLHYFEFVQPIETILKNLGKGFLTRDFKKVSKSEIEKAEKIIICGTSLMDNDFSKSENRKFFEWIKEIKKPIFGICGGMQIIGLIFGGKILRETEIGFFKENFEKEFFGLLGINEVYHLHNYFIDFFRLEDFEIYSVSEKNIAQAVKHKEKEIYGVLFHPEVRQKSVIINLCNL
jgi:GMP synthase (glutamine-hydrolysing)